MQHRLTKILFLAVVLAFATPGPAQIPHRPHRPDRLLQAGHTGLIQALAFSSDGQWLASGGYDKSVVVWNAATGEELRKMTGHSAQLTQLAFSADGSRLASADTNGGVRMWDYQKGTAVYSLNLHGPVGHLGFSPDGKIWAAGIDAAKEGASARIEIHDAATGNALRTIATDWSGVAALTIAPDERLIASGSLDSEDASEGSVHLWNLDSGQLLGSYPLGAVAFSANGRFMARLDFSGQPNTVVISDLSSGLEKQRLKMGNPGSVVFSPDGQQVAVTDPSGSQLKLWSAGTGAEIKTIAAENTTGSTGLAVAVFSPDGKVIAAAPYSGYSVKSWDAATGRELRSFYGQPLIQGIALSPDGSWLVSGSRQGLSLWDRAGAKRIAMLAVNGAANYVVFSQDGRWLAANSGIQFPGETLKVWDMKSRTVAAEFTFGKGGAPVAWMAFAGKASPLTSIGNFTRAWQFTADDGTHTVWSGSSPLAISRDGKLLATQSGMGGNLDIWDLSSGQKLATLAAHRQSITALAFSSDGRWLLTAGQEASPASFTAGNQWGVKVWEVATWKAQIAVSFSRVGAPCAAFSPDGQRLAIEKSWELIELLDVDHNVSLGSLSAVDLQPQNHQFSPANLAFSPDGAFLFQGAQNGIRVWKLAH